MLRARHEACYHPRGTKTAAGSGRFLCGGLYRDHAHRTLKNINEAMMWLKDHPSAGAIEILLPEGRHRRWVVGHVKLVYLVKGSTIHITDVFDSRQDPRKMLI